MKHVIFVLMICDWMKKYMFKINEVQSVALEYLFCPLIYFILKGIFGIFY